MSAATLSPTISDYDPLLGSYGSVDPIPQAAFVSNAERDCLVIGDLHGHLDRFEALLKQEGLLDRCESCNGSGIVMRGAPDPDCDPRHDCRRCDGDGWARTDRDVDVVLVGDIGHFGKDGSPTGDLLTWRAAVLWANVILWGNHDRAMVDQGHAFSGFQRMPHEVFHWIARARNEGKLKLAHTAHDFLITHAGLHLVFKNQKVDPELKSDPYAFAEWINGVEDPDAPFDDVDRIAIRDAVGSKRGGGSPSGGILWRDVNEKLYDGFRQVFGHSADHKSRMIRYCWKDGNSRKFESIPRGANFSYCIDISGSNEVPGAKCLAGIWLPSEDLVRVDL